MNHAPTVHYSFNDISGVVDLWSKSCEAMAVFEHGPDEGQKTVHCHFYMLGCKNGIEAYKKSFHSNFLTFKKANELWAWTHKEFPVIEPLDTSGGMQYLKYISKGHLAPKFLKNISLAKVEEAKALWVNKSPVQLPGNLPKCEFDLILVSLSKKYQDDDANNITVLQIKRDICHMYLSKRKAVPRMGDLTRYAWSAWAIIRNDKLKETLSQDILTYLDSEDKSLQV
jgi:hypothetical protein